MLGSLRNWNIGDIKLPKSQVARQVLWWVECMLQESSRSLKIGFVIWIG